MNHDEHRRRQQVVLDRTLAILKESPSVLGVALYGSYVLGREDAFSDIDLACYLSDEPLSGREALYGAVSKQAPLLCDMWLWNVHALFLFEDGVRLDLDFHPPSALAKHGWMKRAKVLHDPTGALVRAATESDFQGEEASKPGEPIDWFFWMFRQIVCWAKRGEQGDIRTYDKLAGAVQSLSEVRGTLERMRQWTLGWRDYLRHADPVMAEHLADSFPTLTAKDIMRCARVLLLEYERICSDFCAKAGIEYPARKVEVMKRLMDEFDAIGG